MKNLKKLVAVMLAAVCVLAMTACGNDNAKIVGSWTAKCDISEMMAKEVGMDLQFDMELIFVFEKNGTMKITYEQQNIDNMIEQLYDVTLDLAYSQLAEAGMSKAEVDELFETQYGMSAREYLVEGMKEEIAEVRAQFESELSTLSELDAKYELKGDKLYIADMGAKFNDDEYLAVTVDGNSMVCADASNIQEFDGVISSIKFTKNN